VPAFWLEPLLNITPWAMLTFVAAPSRSTLAILLGACVFSMLFTEICARVTRGQGIAFKHLLLVPWRDLLLLGAWARGATLKEITWRGNRLAVGKKSLLSKA
jgi:ceramide glucosyltransferase